MSYVLTNGRHYVKVKETGGVAKTRNISEATVFSTVDEAEAILQKSVRKTRSYYVKDPATNIRYTYPKDTRRIHFPDEVRQLIYNTAQGRCVLCGRKIVYDKMTLDHIVPLAVGGLNDIRNLQCTCEACNLFKGSVLPDDFMERVTEIFLYQMDKKLKNSLRWKLLKPSLRKVVKKAAAV